MFVDAPTNNYIHRFDVSGPIWSGLVPTSNSANLDKSLLTTARPRRLDSAFVLTAVALLALVARFIGLADAPPGFYVDEAVAASEIVCLAETGADSSGASWPLNSVWDSPVGSVVFPASILYPGVLWVQVFGDSIASLRAIGVLASIVVALATAGVARNFLGRSGFAWALLASAFMPWMWDLSRSFLAAGGMIGLATLMCSVYLLTRRTDSAIGGLLSAAAAGFGFAVSLGYNNTRLPALILGITLVVPAVWRGLMRVPDLASLLAGAIVGGAPLLRLVGSGQLLNRSSNVSITDPTWMQDNGIAGPIGVVSTYLRHLVLHMSPDFLFVSGDAELRHHSGISGQLGWLGLLLALLIPVSIWIRWRGGSAIMPRGLLVLSSAGILSGLSSAALTNSALPHANRAIGAVPFIALGLAAVARYVSQRTSYVSIAAVVCSLLFATWFIPQYLNDYPIASQQNFDSFIRASAEDAVASGDIDQFVSEFANWTPRQMFIYFTAAADDGRGCPGALRSQGT